MKKYILRPAKSVEPQKVIRASRHIWPAVAERSGDTAFPRQSKRAHFKIKLSKIASAPARGVHAASMSKSSKLNAPQRFSEFGDG